jgi:glucokinase
MSRYIAVDIGGSRMRAAYYTAEGIVPIRIKRISTRTLDHKKTALTHLEGLILSLIPQDIEIRAISVSVPGLVNPNSGTVLNAPSYPEWRNFPMQKFLSDRFNTPVIVGNDANMAALGEWNYGAGRGHHNLIYVTVSTGIGSGIIVDDHLLLGEQGLAAEIGHIPVMSDVTICSCGKKGHLEAIASGPAIAKWMQNQLARGKKSSLTFDQCDETKRIARAADEGDPLSIAAFERAGKAIGKVLASILHMFNPSAIIIGGGVSRSGPFLLEPLHKAISEHVFHLEYVRKLTLSSSVLGDDVGLVGALTLARSQYPP